MNLEIVCKASAVLAMGGILMSGEFSAGPFREACDPPDAARFACLTLRGEIVPIAEEWDEIEIQFEGDRKGWSARRRERVSHDWSSYGAALAFVAAAGEFEAANAIAVWESRRAG